MKPKPFWPLNHFTVPVVISSSKAHMRVPRDNHAATFNFDDVFGKGARGRDQQGTAANRIAPNIHDFQIFTRKGGNLFSARPPRPVESHSNRPAGPRAALSIDMVAWEWSRNFY